MEATVGGVEGSGCAIRRCLGQRDRELLRLETLLEPPTNLQSCHRDLWADNMLPTPTGGLCVIDWENCGLADPAQELPMAMIDFGLGDQRRIAELYLAYLDAGGPGSDQRLRLVHHGDRTVRPLLGVSDHRLPSNRRRRGKGPQP